MAAKNFSSCKKDILIADPHPRFRTELRRALGCEPAFRVVGEASTAIQAIDIAQRLHPNLALVDIQIPDLHLTINYILRNSPKTRIVLLTLNEDQEDILEVLKYGISAQLRKDISIDTIIASLHAISNGKVLVSPSLTGLILKSMRS
jgi:two-component system nitrate/nitrite response regulator NarL